MIPLFCQVRQNNFRLISLSADTESIGRNFAAGAFFVSTLNHMEEPMKRNGPNTDPMHVAVTRNMPRHSIMMRLPSGRALVLHRRAWSRCEAIGDLESITTGKAIGTCDGCFKPLDDVSPYAIGSCPDCEHAGATRNTQQRKRRALRIANIKANRIEKATGTKRAA